MRLFYDETDAAIAAAVDELLTADPPIAMIRSQAAAPALPDAARWRTWAEQGCFGLALPEDAGGVGYGLGELAVLFRELGRHLAPGPLVPTVVAAHIAHRLGRSDLLGPLVTGSRRAAFVVTDAGSLDELAGEALVPDLDPDGLVVLLLDGRAVLFDAAACPTPTPVEALDPAGRLHSCALPPALAVLDGDAAETVRAEAQILAAAELSGVAEASLSMSVAYAKTRTQFGRPIGSFQAVAHRCATMAARAEAARCQVLFAALAVAAGAHDASFQARAALAVAGQAALGNAADNMRNHGAIAMTAEHDAYLYVTRARTLAATLSTRTALLRSILDGPAPALTGIA